MKGSTASRACRARPAIWRRFSRWLSSSRCTITRRAGSSTGFARNWSAPSFTARTARSIVAWPVSTTTGSDASISRIRGSRSRAVPSGSMWSRTTASGWPSRTALSAAATESASSTSRPSLSRKSRTPKRMPGSSSTIRIFGNGAAGSPSARGLSHAEAGVVLRARGDAQREGVLARRLRRAGRRPAPPLPRPRRLLGAAEQVDGGHGRRRVLPAAGERPDERAARSPGHARAIA